MKSETSRGSHRGGKKRELAAKSLSSAGAGLNGSAQGKKKEVTRQGYRKAWGKERSSR